jgi:hypothetical protein
MGSQGFMLTLMFGACCLIPPGWILAGVLTAGALSLPGLGQRDRKLDRLWNENRF